VKFKEVTVGCNQNDNIVKMIYMLVYVWLYGMVGNFNWILLSTGIKKIHQLLTTLFNCNQRRLTLWHTGWICGR